MGSLTSRPQVLPVQQPSIIEVEPAPTVAATPVTTTTTNTGTDASGGSTDNTDDDATTEAAARSSGLLERSRGLLSTVLTGFDGILTQNTTPQRKSLLGE